MSNAFVDKLFAQFEAAGINWCLLRETESPDESRYQEIDLLVTPSDLSRMAVVLERNGFVTIPSWGHEPHHFYIIYDRLQDAWLKVDVVTELRYGYGIRALRFEKPDRPLATCRRRHGLAFLLSAEDEFITLLLHCLLDKRGFRPGRQRRLSELLDQVLAEPESQGRLRERVAKRLSPALTWEMLIRAHGLRDWDVLLSRRSALARQLFLRAPVCNAWRWLTGWVTRRLRPLFLALQRRGLSVALLAPDGAGKTLLAQQLSCDPFLRAQLIYMGINREPSTLELRFWRWLEEFVPAVTRRKAANGVRFVSRVLKQWWRILLGTFQKLRGRLVIFDRYIYDTWVVRQPVTRGQRFRRWLLEVGWPTPDLVILLDAPGVLLHARKNQHSAEQLERQRLAYHTLKDRIPRMVLINAAQTKDDVRREVTSLIWSHYRERSAH